jgi:DDE superfamily endonuclease
LAYVARLVVPPNITIITLPSKSPELNPVENIWRFMRDNWLSNRVFKSYERWLRAEVIGAIKNASPIHRRAFQPRPSLSHQGPPRRASAVAGRCARYLPLHAGH